MQALEDAIERAEDRIEHLPPSEIRRLRESMQIPPDDLGDALALSLAAGRITARELNLVEHFIETWPQLGLSAKLAILNRIKSLSDGCVEWQV